ncbi:MAG: cell division protein FtsB [Firmicutes bacterium ADurb.Bin506]|jgi:cell division protein FtsB|nr:MAG: cell division protein FtsB [Firmicutes bacterium ADurb.Bin506]
MSQRAFRWTIIAAVVLFGLSLAAGISRVASINRQTALLLQECEQWSDRVDDVNAEIGVATSDEYVERVARERLGLVKPGETLYVVAQPDTSGFEPVKPRPGHTPEIGD